jgi:hypothetical protein
MFPPNKLTTSAQARSWSAPLISHQSWYYRTLLMAYAEVKLKGKEFSLQVQNYSVVNERNTCDSYISDAVPTAKVIASNEMLKFMDGETERTGERACYFQVYTRICFERRNTLSQALDNGSRLRQRAVPPPYITTRIWYVSASVPKKVGVWRKIENIYWIYIRPAALRK